MRERRPVFLVQRLEIYFDPMPPKFPDWYEKLQETKDPGFDSIRAAIEQRKTGVQVAKLRCTNCGKEEHDRKPLQSCSQCRSVRYCDRNCQVTHYRASHKADCAAFKVPPLCRAFSVDIRPHGIYPEHPIFAQGHAQNGVGAWVSIAGQVDARLSHHVGGKVPSDTDDMTPENTLNALPGTSGDFLGLTILVQNRQNPKTSTKVVVHAADILAVTTPRGSDILLQGRKPGERVSTIEDPDTRRSLAVLFAKHVGITHLNGKEIKKAEKKHPSIIDQETCSVSLGPGDYAIYHVDYRVGGPRVERDYQALERLSYFEIPYSDGDGTKCKLRTKMDYVAINDWYKDFQEKGEYAYLVSHFGEARAKFVTAGVQALSGHLGMMMQMAMSGQMGQMGGGRR